MLFTCGRGSTCRLNAKSGRNRSILSADSLLSQPCAAAAGLCGGACISATTYPLRATTLEPSPPLTTTTGKLTGGPRRAKGVDEWQKCRHIAQVRPVFRQHVQLWWGSKNAKHSSTSYIACRLKDLACPASFNFVCYQDHIARTTPTSVVPLSLPCPHAISARSSPLRLLSMIQTRPYLVCHAGTSLR